MTDQDPKRQVGAYLAWHGRALLEVLADQDGQLLVANCKTGYVMTLDADELTDTQLVIPTPDELEHLAAAPPTEAAAAADQSPINKEY